MKGLNIGKHASYYSYVYFSSTFTHSHPSNLLNPEVYTNCFRRWEYFLCFNWRYRNEDCIKSRQPELGNTCHYPHFIAFKADIYILLGLPGIQSKALEKLTLPHSGQYLDSSPSLSPRENLGTFRTLARWLLFFGGGRSPYWSLVCVCSILPK